MKSKLIKLVFTPLALVALFFTSCSNDDFEVTTENSSNFTIELTKQSTETDEVSTGAMNIVELAYTEIEEASGRNTSFFSDCVTITITNENDITFVDLDFGLGCELNNGITVSGIIHLTYGVPQNETRTINYSYENFFFNEKGIAGGGTIFREHSNENGNPQSTIQKNIEVTFPSGLIAIVNGNKVREWIEGFGSGTWIDNVYLITGSWTHEFNNGFFRSATVIEVLRREATCHYFVSGLVEVTRNETTGVLDYGDGICDNEAILTVNGEEIVIILHH
ncbi:MAG: hypothetical protein QM499_09145 [Flavobacteriaceae bacterium]